MDTDPAREEHGGERVSGLVVGLDQKKEEMLKLLGQIKEQLNQRAIEIEEKEKWVNEKLKEVEERESNVTLRENSTKEKEGELEGVESSLMRLVVEKMKDVEEKVKEFELLKQKNTELGEGSVQAQAEAESTKKRSRAECSLIGCSSKRLNHDDGEEKETESSEEEEVEIIAGGDNEEVTTEPISCPVESEFHSFKKTINSFEVGQLWALYDRGVDGMPRLYGRIKGIVKSRSVITVQWLNLKESVHVPVPVACGRFQYGKREAIDHLAFSHEMQNVVTRGRYSDVYPKKGEVWALFREWNNNNTHQLHNNYDFVEILADFDARLGVGGVYLDKVDGFVSVFKHAEQQQQQERRGGGVTLFVPADVMNRFSHKVPFFNLSGDEKQGVPVGSFELDPASVPSSMLKRRDNKEPKKEGTERQNGVEAAAAADHQNGTTIDVPIILD